MVELGSLLFFYLIWDPSSWRSSLQKQGFSRFFTLGWHSWLWFVTLSSHVFKAPLFFSFFKHGLMGFWAGSCHRNDLKHQDWHCEFNAYTPTSQPTPGTVIQYRDPSFQQNIQAFDDLDGQLKLAQNSWHFFGGNLNALIFFSQECENPRVSPFTSCLVWFLQCQPQQKTPTHRHVV